MYAGHFGLHQAPFSIAPDPHYLYMSERHREALAHLLYGVQGGGGFVLLTGEIGAGKTTVCRAFLEQLPEHCRVAYIFNPKLTVAELLRTVCQEFHVTPRSRSHGAATITDHIEPLNEYLLANHAQGLHNLLIIDEAQALSPHVLEQLRLLTNLETTERKLLQIVLIGQPELRQLLARPALEQVAQRVIARFHLQALNEAETRQYIAHRMAVAGLTGPLPFSAAALARIHALTRGVPRRINLLCDRALLGAYASERREVDKAIVDRAALEIFDTSKTATPVRVARKPSRPWGILGLGALVGASALGLTVLALWQWPLPITDLLPVTTASTQPPTPLPDPPAAVPSPVMAISAPSGTTTEPALASDPSPAAPGGPPSAAKEIPLQAQLPARTALLAREAQGWIELGTLWDRSLTEDDACASAQQQGLQCFRTPRMTLHGLRQLDRPGVLTLHLPDGPARALILSLTTETATLQAGGQRWRLPLDRLTEVWRGEYATLWRTPPGSTERIGNVSDGPAARWMDRQLRQLQADGHLPAQARDATQRLQAFQASQGIEGGGKATPMTFMQVNRLSGIEEPRLSTP
jgi:general secretion pathway protein A